MIIEEIYGNQEDFEKYLLVSNIGFESGVLEKKVGESVNMILGQYLSKVQYDFSKTQTADIHEQLIEYFKQAVACNAMVLAFPYLKVQLDAGGIQYGSGRDNQATISDKEDLYLAFFRDANKAIDMMLQLLNSDHTAFVIWKASSAFVDFSKYFIRTPAEFGIINDSFSVFCIIRPTMQIVETLVLKKILGDTLFAQIKFQLRAKTLSAEKLDLWENYIVPFLARETLYRSVSDLSVVKDKYGTICIYDDTAAGKTRGYKSAEIDRISAWKKELSYQANELLDALKTYVSNNATALGITVSVINLRFENPEDFSTTFH